MCTCPELYLGPRPTGVRNLGERRLAHGVGAEHRRPVAARVRYPWLRRWLEDVGAERAGEDDR